MNPGGTLRKRKRRNLTKVQGTTVPYNEAADNFDSKHVFRSTDQYQIRNSQQIAFTTGHDTRIRMTPLFQQQQQDNLEQRKFATNRPGTRVTRDPTFHIVDFDPPIQGENDEMEDPPLDYASTETDRPYFLDKSTMARLKQIILLAICSGTVPWYFDSKTHRIERWPPTLEHLWRIQWICVTFQTIALTLFQFYTFVGEIGQNSGQYREVFMSSVSVYWYVCAVYFNVNMWLYKERIREYINSLFKFNHDFVG